MTSKHNRWKQWLVLILMLVLFVQLCCGSKHLSLTSDEPAHLANGYGILSTGELWSIPPHGHPPLINIWTAWPVLLQQDRPDVHTIPGWQENLIVFIRHLWDKFGSLDRLAFIIRYPNILLAIILMALVYRWAREWASPKAGILAMVIMTWDPTLIAHAQLNTTDLGMTLFTFAVFYLLWRLQQKFSWITLIGIGILNGAAMSAKASGLMILPLVCLALSWCYLLETHKQWIDLLTKFGTYQAHQHHILTISLKWLFRILVSVAIAMVTLWATYGFEWRPYPLATHINMLKIFFAGKDRLAFLHGMLRQGGWWWYFPYAFAIKTPLPAIIAYLIGFLLAIKTPLKLLRDAPVLWLFPTVYIATALFGGVDIGYRHLLPVFPFIYVNTSRISIYLSRYRTKSYNRVLQVTALLLSVWYIIGTVRVYPFSLAYFNELIGGPKNGYRYLVDSNVDWGHAFKALKGYMDQNHIAEVSISYSTWVDPGAYGIHYKPLFPAQGTEAYMPQRYDPAPGIYAISASTLQGIALKEHDPDLYEWFRHQQPQAQPGYGMLVYEVVPHSPSAEWIAQCNIPVVTLDAPTIHNGFGRDDLRQLTFDCTQSWVYPGGGENTGWYTFAHDMWANASEFMQAHLSPARFSYEQQRSSAVPAFTLFEWSGNSTIHLPETMEELKAAPIEWPPAQVNAEVPTSTTPVTLGETLDFLGYRVIKIPEENVVELWTAWQVRIVPTRPLSLIGHLVQANAIPIAVSDGLGFLPEQWQIGDIIIQRHHFDLSQEILPGTYWLQTGAYWLDTQERLPVQNLVMEADRLLLTSIEVR